MKPRWLWVGSIAAAALVWFASPELHWPARLFVALLLGPMPVAFMMQALGLDTVPRPLPKMPLYFGTIIGLWVLALLTVGVAVQSGFRFRLLGLHLINPALLLLWTLAGVLGAAAVVLLFKALGHQDSELMQEIVPVTIREKTVFVILSITAGVCEELTFRGFLVAALLVATGSVVLAVLLSSVVFGLMHAHQGTGGALRAACLGMVLCVPLLLTGSVYPSMAAHALADIAGGLWLARWLIR